MPNENNKVTIKIRFFLIFLYTSQAGNGCSMTR
jgi:hypothetical protein